MDVIDRLITEYGVKFFKIDYNVTTGPGSHLNTDSMGEAMLEHYRYLYQWYEEIYRKYPDIVIEKWWFRCTADGLWDFVSSESAVN